MPRLPTPLRSLIATTAADASAGGPGTSSASAWRSACSCGSRDISWTRLADLEDSAFKAAMLDALSPDAEAWRCGSCGEVGAFDSAEWV